MRSLWGFSLSCFILLGLISLPSHLAFAEEKTSESSHAFNPIVALKEYSKPVFDPESFKEKQAQADEFLQKMQKEQKEFESDKLEHRRKTFEKLKNANYSDEKRQKKFAEFHQEELEKTARFKTKQQNKIDKHYKKDSDKQWIKWF